MNQSEGAGKAPLGYKEIQGLHPTHDVAPVFGIENTGTVAMGAAGKC